MAGQPEAFLIGTIKEFVVCEVGQKKEILCYVWERRVVECSDQMYTVMKYLDNGAVPKLIHIDRISRQIHLAPFYTDLKANRKKRSANDQIVYEQEPNVEESKEVEADTRDSDKDTNAMLIAIPMRETL